MKKYKVGDMVTVRKDLVSGYKYGSTYFISSMSNFLGKKCRITHINEYDEYELDDNDMYCFTDEMLVNKKIKNITFEKYKKCEEYV